MSGLIKYSLIKYARTTEEESDNLFAPAPNPNDGTNDPNNRFELEDVEEVNAGNAAVGKPDDYFGWKRPLKWDRGWYNPANGGPEVMFTQPTMPPRTPREAYNEHVFGEPASTSMGLGGGTGYYDNTMYFDSGAGKYKKNTNISSHMMPDAHYMNRNHSMSRKPHLVFDKATGKYFNPSHGAPNSPQYSGLVNVPNSQGDTTQKIHVKNPVFGRAVNEYNMRNDPNSILGKSINDRIARLTGKPSKTPAQQAQRAMRPTPTPA